MHAEEVRGQVVIDPTEVVKMDATFITTEVAY